MGRLLDIRKPEKGKFYEKGDNLRAQRRARGECFKCGEKFGPGHKCPTSIQIHVIEELLSALQLPDNSDEAPAREDSDAPSDTEETVMKLSIQAVSGTSCKESIKLQGMIGKLICSF